MTVIPWVISMEMQLISARLQHFRFQIPVSILVGAKVQILQWITNMGNAGIDTTQAIHLNKGG